MPLLIASNLGNITASPLTFIGIRKTWPAGGGSSAPTVGGGGILEVETNRISRFGPPNATLETYCSGTEILRTTAGMLKCKKNSRVENCALCQEKLEPIFLFYLGSIFRTVPSPYTPTYNIPCESCVMPRRDEVFNTSTAIRSRVGPRISRKYQYNLSIIYCAAQNASKSL